MKKNILFILCMGFLIGMSCYKDEKTIPPKDDVPQEHLQVAGDALLQSSSDLSFNEIQEKNDGTLEEEGVEDVVALPEEELYPPGPYDIGLFEVMPDMTFYDPWNNVWVSLSEYYKHEKLKALIIVSSAGWCGPCLMEAAALVDLYNRYEADGLGIIYTLGNTNIPGDVPFDTTAATPESAAFAIDLEFMENWKAATASQAGKMVNYSMYADPYREFLPYLPNHNWPLSIIVTTKDMGIRLVEEGYWSALMENKVMLVLYNDVPSIPFE
jgi:thiol-disulfide isomerase/thioredoxin